MIQPWVFVHDSLPFEVMDEVVVASIYGNTENLFEMEFLMNE